MFLLSSILVHTFIHTTSNARLKYAVIKNNIEQAKQALQEGAHVHDSSLLHDALFSRSKKMIKLLLNYGIVLNEFYATIEIPERYRSFTHMGIDIALPLYEGPGNALSIALFLKDTRLLKILLRYGATLHHEEYLKKSEEYTRIKKLVNSLGAEGIFFSALLDDDPVNLQALLTQSAPETHVQVPKQNKLKRLKNLFKQPKQPFTLNASNRHDKTPLMLAAIAGKEQIVLFLLHARVNAELKDNQGNTAHTLARHHGNMRIAELIESYVLFYRKLIFIQYITKNNTVGITQDIAERIADYAITLD